MLGEKVYQTVIPRNVRVSEAPSYGKPVLLYDHDCAGSQAYIRLASEIIRRERDLQSGVNGGRYRWQNERGEDGHEPATEAPARPGTGGADRR